MRMEAHTPTSSLFSEAPVAVYEVAFSGIRIASGTRGKGSRLKGRSHLLVPSGPALNPTTQIEEKND